MGGDQKNVAYPFDHLIYSVGHCPPRGIDSNLARELSRKEISEELQRHAIGLVHIFELFGKHTKDNGSLTVINSAITDIPDNAWPENLHIGPYAAACAAKHELVRAMRHENPQLRVNELQFGSIESDFFNGCTFRPPVTLPMKRVVDEVEAAINSPACYNKTLRATSPEEAVYRKSPHTA